MMAGALASSPVPGSPAAAAAAMYGGAYGGQVCWVPLSVAAACRLPRCSLLLLASLLSLLPCRCFLSSPPSCLFACRVCAPRLPNLQMAGSGMTAQDMMAMQYGYGQGMMPAGAMMAPMPGQQADNLNKTVAMHCCACFRQTSFLAPRCPALTCPHCVCLPACLPAIPAPPAGMMYQSPGGGGGMPYGMVAMQPYGYMAMRPGQVSAV